MQTLISSFGQLSTVLEATLQDIVSHMIGRTLNRRHYYLLVVVAFLAIISAYRPSQITLDSSIFLSMGHHLREGRVLYSGVWDNKPPVTYLAYYIAYALWPDVRVVHFLRLFAFCCTSIALTLVMLRKKDDIKTLLVTMVPAFLLLHSLNEQTCSADLLGLMFFSLFLASALCYGAWPLAAFFAALTVLCKEPYCLIVLPWLVQGFWALAENLDEQQLTKRRWKMFLAFLFPNALFLVYLLVTGAYGDYIYTIGLNFAFSQRKTSQSLISFMLFKSTIAIRLLLPLIVFLGYAVKSRLEEDEKTEDTVLLFGLLLSSIAMSLAKRDFLNYAIMAYGPMVLALHRLVSLTFSKMKNEAVMLRKVILLSFCLYFALFSTLLTMGLWQQERAAVQFFGWDYWNYFKRNAMYQYLLGKVRAGDGLWIPYGGIYWLYPALGQVSPTAMHFYFTSVQGRPDERVRKKLLHYYSEVRQNPPKYIIDGATEETAILLAEPVMQSWLIDNYEKVLKKKSNGDQLVLWQHL